MAAGKRTPPEVVERVIALARQGKTVREVVADTGVHRSTALRIVAATPDAEWARMGSGSAGTPEAMARANSYRSAYARNRRNEIAEQLLNQIVRANELAMKETDPRKFQALMQAADAATRAYNVITKTDQAGDGGALQRGRPVAEPGVDRDAAAQQAARPRRLHVLRRRHRRARRRLGGGAHAGHHFEPRAAEGDRRIVLDEQAEVVLCRNVAVGPRARGGVGRKGVQHVVDLQMGGKRTLWSRHALRSLSRLGGQDRVGFTRTAQKSMQRPFFSQSP